MTPLTVPLLCLLAATPVAARANEPARAAPPPQGTRATIRFQKPSPQSEPEQVRLRLHAAEQPPPYDLARETFEILVPKDYSPSTPHGLFIWISAGNDPIIPGEWDAVLAEKRLIFIGARQSGNARNIFDRIRMAVDANVSLRDLYRVDGRRVYVSGFSGGGRVASMLGVAFGEMFSGTVCFMGVNFYTDTTGTDGKTYGLSYLPDDNVLALAKRFCRYALVTGEKDFNRPNTRGVLENGFRKEGFAAARLFDIPGQGHAPPAANWLRQALDFLDEGKK